MMGKRGTMSYEVERTMRTIFKRCIKCPDVTPSCPKCKSTEICSLVPADCNTCAQMKCIANPNPAPTSRGPNVGAIAGGVVGGVAFIAVVVFCIYWFWIRKRRQQQEADGWVSEDEWEEEDDITQQKLGGERRFNAFKSQDAMSTRTRGSVANSILSRASNIIQIAFIPGVTTRNGSGHNSLLNNSPVPPVPAAQRNIPRSPLSNQDDALFFRPGDLRDSTYSGTESLGSNRDTQYLRHQSITPSLVRSSVASSTIYRDDATEVPMPATQGVRAAARMISVRSNVSADGQGSGSSTPTTGHVTTPSGSKKPVQVLMPGQASSPGPSHTSSVRSVASYGRPTQVSITKNTPKRVEGPSGRLSREASDASFNTAQTSGTANAKPSVSSPLARYSDESEEEEEEEEEEHARGKQELIDTSTATSAPVVTPLIQPVESPFFDASERPTGANRGYFQSRPNPYASMASSIASASHDKPGRAGRGMGGLSAVIEEATKRASKTGTSPSASQKSIAEDDEQGTQGPFADRHRASGGD